MNNGRSNISRKPVSQSLFMFTIVGITILLVLFQLWMFHMGMTKVQVDPKNIPDSFPVVCMTDIHGKWTPIVFRKHKLDDVIAEYENYGEYLRYHSYLLSLSKIDELQQHTKQEYDGWVDAKGMAGGRQLINVFDGRGGHGLLQDAGWYIADKRGYKPLYFARVFYPFVFMKSFLISVVLCFVVRLITCFRRRRYSMEST